MDNASAIALSRLAASAREMDVIANNIANSDTPGFKAERMQFADWMFRQSRVNPPPGGRTLHFVVDRADWHDLRPGALRRTGNPLDLALGGGGFFTVRTPQGVRLTRDGRFGLMPDGTIADASGNPVLDNSGQPIQIATGDSGITVAADGTISTAQNGIIGQIGVVRPQNPMALQSAGGNLFLATGPTMAVASPGVIQGTLEGSNVQPVLELTRMMTALRNFQFVASFAKSEASLEQSAIDRIAQPAA